MIAEIKTCVCCSRSIQGRSDKKFCNDLCRNAHHNSLKTAGDGHVRKINLRLSHNRRVLEKMAASSKHIIKTTKQKLVEQRFDFYYFTHQYLNRKGQRYFFCYEFGYRVLKDVVVIIRRKG